MKQSTNHEPYVPSKETLEKLRRALNGEYDTAEESTAVTTTTTSENQIKEGNNQS